MKLRELTEPTIFKHKYKHYMSSNAFCFSRTFMYCLDLESGDIVQLSLDTEVMLGEQAGFKIVKVP